LVPAHIVFQIGDPGYHPLAEQVQMLRSWLGLEFASRLYDGREAFEHLDNCDLLVLMGHHKPGDVNTTGPYRPLLARHQEALTAYVASGRPLIAHHAGICSYADWPRYGELVGFAWRWGYTGHSPYHTFAVQAQTTAHPIMRDITDFTIDDELYFQIAFAPGLPVMSHASAVWNEQRWPLVCTAEGGRIAGAGRTAYIAHGHDMRSFACPMLPQLWRNAVTWALGRD
jgi:type 1 glutamine amidotransferase